MNHSTNQQQPVTIIIDYAQDEPVVQGVGGTDIAGALRVPVEKIVVRNAALADDHPEVRDSIEEMQNCGYRVAVES